MPYDLFISDVQRDNQPPYPGDLRSWVTALHDEQVMEALKSQAVSQILHKPLKEEALLATVAEALTQSV